ncbi:MAG TPA: carbon storage regulator CsrA [Pirellulales bacterium]|nr:carbon storage regulator CsrA [Pirellulales bacterium]
MLVISRQVNESLVINGDITVVVVAIRGDKVRLGVESPPDVAVHRHEAYDAIHRTKQPTETAPEPCAPMIYICG